MSLVGFGLKGLSDQGTASEVKDFSQQELFLSFLGKVSTKHFLFSEMPPGTTTRPLTDSLQISTEMQ